jgi:hypothetical protein
MIQVYNSVGELTKDIRFSWYVKSDILYSAVCCQATKINY